MLHFFGMQCDEQELSTTTGILKPLYKLFDCFFLLLESGQNYRLSTNSKAKAEVLRETASFFVKQAKGIVPDTRTTQCVSGESRVTKKPVESSKWE